MLKIKNLHNLQLFVLTVDCGSLSKAARRLNLSPAMVSASVKRLEEELGVMLLVRSTRSLRLSPAGEQFLPAARIALTELQSAIDALWGGEHLAGSHQLQISMPSDLGRNQMTAWLDTFQTRHPNISLRLQLSDQVSDLYRQPVDIAIRYGSLPDSSLLAFSLAPENRRVLCAAPSYIARAGIPDTPHELSKHNCLMFHLSDHVYDAWRFEPVVAKHKPGQSAGPLKVLVAGNRVSDDGDVVRRWALAGLGIAYKSQLDIQPDLAAGRLVDLLQAGKKQLWRGEAAPLSFICADRRQLLPTVVLLRDYLRQCCMTALGGIRE